MAELSAETQAIIDRLQAEGNLLRNTGTHSIRSVKVELAKFEGIFNTISNNIAAQTDTMRASMGAQADIAERQAEQAARERAFADLDTGESAELKALREKVETAKLKNDLASEKEKSKGKGLFEQLKGLQNMKFLAAGAFGIGAVTIGYGYLNSRTDGGLDRMVDSIAETAWDKISKSLNLVAEKAPLILSQMEAALTPENLEKLATTAGTAVVAGLGIGAAGLAAVPIAEMIRDGLVSYGVIEALRRRGGTPGLPPGTLPDAPDRGPGGLGGRDMGRGIRVPNLRSLSVAGLATLALDALMPAMGDAIRKNVMGMSDNDIINKKYDAVDFGGTVLKYASIGLMFGPKGAVVGAAVGAAIGIGQKIADVIKDDLYDEGAITNVMEDSLENIEDIKTDAESKLQTMLEEREALSKSLTEQQLENIGLGNAAIQAQRDIVEAENAAIREEATAAAQRSAREIQEKIDELAEKEFRAQRQRRGRRVGESDEAYARAKAEFDRERIAEMQRLQAQQDQTITTAVMAGADEERIMSYLERLENPLTAEQAKAVNDQMLRDLGVIDANGRLLGTLEENAPGMTMPIIVNQNTTNAPVTTHVVKQGDNVRTEVNTAFGGQGMLSSLGNPAG